MKGFVRKTLTGWVPADKASEAMHKRHKLNAVLKAEIVQPRSYKHHCMFMALLELTFANQDRYTDDWAFRSAVALAAGHAREFVTVDGEIHWVPMRYSYDDIPDQGDFGTEFGKAMAVCADMLGERNLKHLQAEVEQYATRHYGVAA